MVLPALPSAALLRNPDGAAAFCCLSSCGCCCCRCYSSHARRRRRRTSWQGFNYVNCHPGKLGRGPQRIASFFIASSSFDLPLFGSCLDRLLWPEPEYGQVKKLPYIWTKPGKVSQSHRSRDDIFCNIVDRMIFLREMNA